MFQGLDFKPMHKSSVMTASGNGLSGQELEEQGSKSSHGQSSIRPETPVISQLLPHSAEWRRAAHSSRPGDQSDSSLLDR